MALRATKPEAVKKRLKALFFGEAGVGKTTASIRFPKPYLIDTERGSENEQYTKALAASGGVIFQSSDAEEVIREVTSLLSEQHDYATLVIDPITVLYDQLLDRGADELGTDFGKHKQPANRSMKHLLNLLYRLDMNVIVTSHAKPLWVRTKDSRGKDTVASRGITFDAYDKLDYAFDLVVEVERRGKDRVGIIRKSRLEAFPDGETFPFNYETIADLYGRDILERGANPQALASDEQVAKLRGLLDDVNESPDMIAKFLAKYMAEGFGELPADAAQRAIDHYENRLKVSQKGAE